jgi:predicted amino acid-binding ACT domain protein
MPSFHVRFKGMLTQIERQQLAAAGVELVDSEASVAGGVAVFTARVEADSADVALAAVREALEPDTANFSDWESRPA